VSRTSISASALTTSIARETRSLRFAIVTQGVQREEFCQLRATVAVGKASAMCSTCALRGECVEVGEDEAGGSWDGVVERQSRQVRKAS
jgi:hypothetical protein